MQEPNFKFENAIIENPVDHKYRFVGFLLPIVNGEFYVAQRNTEPYSGMFGAVGGKNELDFQPDKFVQNHEYMVNGFPSSSYSDIIVELAGREPLSSTAAREFCEEMFEGLYPDLVGESDITDLLRIGWVADVLPEVPDVTNICYFYIANVMANGPEDFRKSEREIGDISRLNEVDPDNIFLLTNMALLQYQHLVSASELGNTSYQFNENHLVDSPENINIGPVAEFRETNMQGVINHYYSNQIEMPQVAYGRYTFRSIESPFAEGLTPDQVFIPENFAKHIKKKLV